MSLIRDFLKSDELLPIFLVMFSLIASIGYFRNIWWMVTLFWFLTGNFVKFRYFVVLSTICIILHNIF